MNLNLVTGIVLGVFGGTVGVIIAIISIHVRRYCDKVVH